MAYNLKTRIKISGLIMLVPAALIIGRLFYLQTFRHEEFAAKTERAIYAELAEDRVRGDILDAEGNILASSLRTHSCAVLKRYVNDKNEVIKTLSSVLKIPEKDLRKRWEKEGHFFYVAKKIKPDVYQQLTKAIREKRLSGIEMTPEYERIHPYGNLALGVIGASNSKNYGLSGIEQIYNQTLSYDISRKRARKARAGTVIYDHGLKEEEKISDVKLTIDALSQYHVEEVLKKYVQENGAERGMAIVQDPHTGFILAMASYPSIDGQSLPFQYTYEPGSTFKTITSAAALDSLRWKTETPMKFESKDKWEIPGTTRTIRDTHNKREEMTVAEMMQVSSNRGAARLAHEVGAKDFFYYIKAFGFGTKSDIGFHGEAKGTVREYAKWNKIDTAVAGYGYGISLTGIQLISAYSVIANGGYLMQAHLVDSVTDSKGRVTYRAKTNKIRKVLKPETVSAMTNILRSVVEKGTARRAGVKGYTVAGKTGTAEKLGASGTYESKNHIVSFCGFVPASRPAFTILIVMDNPSRPLFGGESAAPAFADIAERLLAVKGVPPDNLKEQK